MAEKLLLVGPEALLRPAADRLTGDQFEPLIVDPSQAPPATLPSLTAYRAVVVSLTEGGKVSADVFRRLKDQVAALKGTEKKWIPIVLVEQRGAAVQAADPARSFADNLRDLPSAPVIKRVVAD